MNKIERRKKLEEDFINEGIVNITNSAYGYLRFQTNLKCVHLELKEEDNKLKLFIDIESRDEKTRKTQFAEVADIIIYKSNKSGMNCTADPVNNQFRFVEKEFVLDNSSLVINYVIELLNKF